MKAVRAIALGLIMTTCAFGNAVSATIAEAVRDQNYDALRGILLRSTLHDVNASGRNGVTPLHIAAKVNNAPCARLLIKHEANIEAKDKNGATPLHWAAACNALDVAEVLAVAGASMRATSNSGLTPLHWAVLSNSVNIAKLLIALGADVNAETPDGATVLHLAASSDDPDMIRLLISSGADLSATTKSGLTPQSLAKSTTSRELLSAPVDSPIDPHAMVSEPVIPDTDPGSLGEMNSQVDALATNSLEEPSLAHDSPVGLSSVAQETRAIRIYGGGGLMSGYTTYRIGGRTVTAYGVDQLHFPISELEFPLDVTIGTVGIAVDVGRGILLDVSAGMNLSSEAGVMKDSDFGYVYQSFGLPGFGPDSLDIYSESDAELDARFFDATLQFRILRGKSTDLFLGIGYRTEQFDYKITNLDQWYPSARPSGSLFGHHDYDPGLVATYQVDYTMAYIELRGQCNLSSNITVEAYVAFAPWAEAEDTDEHLLRGKVTKIEAEGDALMLGVSARYDLPSGRFPLTQNLFLRGMIDYTRITTVGYQRQWIDGYYFAYLDAEVESEQTQVLVSLGKTF